MITLQGVSKFLGKRDLFQNVSFHISAGERIGLIGVNGAGKTTLFHILLAETEPDTGSVLRPKGLRMGYLPQQWTPVENTSILAYAMDVDQQLSAVQGELADIERSLETETQTEGMKEMALRQAHLLEQIEHLGGYDLEARARKVLAGLGFRDEMLDRNVSTLSGGWVMRLELARLLLSEPDVLLLDEPTNHLDLESLLWLENYLLGSSSAMVIISHDRAFLNRLVTRILELDHGKLEEYSGNYDSYLREKAGRQEIRAASYKNQQERIRQVERFIEKNRSRKDKARLVQSRIKSLGKMEPIEAPEEGDAAIHFDFPEPDRAGRRVVELQRVGKAYEGHTVYESIDLVIERGDRVAFMGINGAGKSTLLKIIAGVEPATSGELLVGHNVSLGYYAQYQWEQLHPEWTVLEEAASVAGSLSQSHLRGLLGAFLFRADDVMKRVVALSGGEKARLLLCKLLLQRPNVLLLDEPTNHLDIPSRDVLEKALQRFPGTICFISHDRHFINAIADKVLVVDSGRIHLFPGNFDDYQSIWKERVDAAAPTPETKASSLPGRKQQDRKRLEAEWRNELYALKKPLQRRVEELESALDEKHRQLEEMNALLADPDIYQSGARVQELQRDYQECKKEIQKLTEKWEESALSLEDLETNFWKQKELTALSSS